MDERLRRLLLVVLVGLTAGFALLALRPSLAAQLTGIEGRWALGFAVAYLAVTPVALLGGELYLSRLFTLVGLAVAVIAVVPVSTPTVWERFAGVVALFPLVVVAPGSLRGVVTALVLPIGAYAVLAYRYLFATTVGAGLDLSLAAMSVGYLAALAAGLPLALVGIGLHRPETDRLRVV